MDFGTTCYTQETPGFLWDAFTKGPADDYERYSQRLTRLIAADVLANNPDELDPQQQEIAERLADEVTW